MPTVLHRTLRRRALGGAVALALIPSALVAVPAQADPDHPVDVADEEVHTEDHGHDHVHELTSLGDPFAEGLVVPQDPYVAEPVTGLGVRAVPETPAEWVGPAPDPGDLPQEWLTATPAQTITPSTSAELLADRTGLEGAGTTVDGAPLPDAVLDSVPSPPSKSLPPQLDAAPGWQYSYSCEPNDRPGMVAFAELISAHYDRPGYSTSRRCLAADNSQHYEGRAVDWTMDAYDPDDKAIGDAAAQWLTANNGEMARRFGVMSIIWNRQAWYLYSPGSWRAYNGPSPHTDHLHISFTWDGAMKRTSWWDGTPVTTHDNGTCRVYAGQYAPRYTGRNTTPCATDLPQPPSSPYPVMLPHASNETVKVAQRALGFTGGQVDGVFGPQTLSALLTYQAQTNLYVTGVLDNQTWHRMTTEGPPAPPPGDVVRISGPNRYATNSLSTQSYPRGGEVFVTAGADFPDALAAAGRAGSLNRPVLLVAQSSIPAETETALERLAPSRITIVGGTGAVSSSVATQLGSYTTGSVRRLAGEDRFGTAAEVALEYATGVPVVYVAVGADYPDALAGAARAGHTNGPVLLTRSTSVPEATRAAMQELQPGRVVVLGASGVVSDAVAQELKNLTTQRNLQRVAGGDRYETAAAVASYYPAGLDTVYVATGLNFPDALSAAALAGRDGAPVLLTRPGSLPGATAQQLNRLSPDQIVVLGGTTSVSTTVLNQLARYTD